jgi:Arc/MetJ-type ribon-helix-helix transcriptional regulator
MNNTSQRTRNVVLNIEQDILIDKLVASGLYQDADAVVQAGLNLLNNDIEHHKTEINQIAHDICLSMQEEANGQYIEGTPEEVFGKVFEEAVKEHKM